MSELINNNKEQKYISPEQRDLLIEFLKKRLDLDISNYSLASVSRRFTKMFNDFESDSAQEFISKIEEEGSPRDFFLKHFTVNVTEMFRDPGFYANLVNLVFPVLAQKEQITIWSAACSSGEEVVSLAILLHEAGLLDKSRILGTDISQAMINYAMHAKYKVRGMSGYDKSYKLSGGQYALEEYLEKKGDYAIVKPFLLKHIEYAQHNLMHEPPAEGFDLIVCRNVLIYFDKDLQNQVLSKLANALLPGKSFLALGSKESIIFYNGRERFKEIDREYKIFQKTQ